MTMNQAAVVAGVERCRSDLSQLGSFEELDQVLTWGSLSNRQTQERLGTIDLAFDVLRRRVDSPLALRGRMWAWLQSFVIVDDLDDKRELQTIDSFVARGGIELAVSELDRPNCDFSSIVLSTLAWCSMNPIHVPRIMGTGVHKDAIRYIHSDRPELMDIYMALIRGLCGLPFSATQRTLRADGAVDVVARFLEDLSPEHDDIRVRRGFRAASIITRLGIMESNNNHCGGATGVVRFVMEGNRLVLGRMVEMLDRVLDAGPRGTVINMAIDPHLITMDLLILARISSNHRYLEEAVPVMLRALVLRGETNMAMTLDIIQVYASLVEHSGCLRRLKRLVPKLKEMFIHIFSRTRDASAIKLVRQFVASVEAAQVDFGPIAQHQDDDESTSDEDEHMPSDSSDESMTIDDDDLDDDEEMEVEAEPLRPSHYSTRPPRDHSGAPIAECGSRPRVALLYHWQGIEQAMKVEALLRMHGAHVWVDYASSSSSSSSLSQFNPSCVIVFMSSPFCLSNVCRFEYQCCMNAKM